MPHHHQDSFVLEEELMKCPKHMRFSRGKNSKRLCVPICNKDERYSPLHRTCLPKGSRSPRKKYAYKPKSKQVRNWIVGKDGKDRYPLAEWRRCDPGSHRSPTSPKYCIKGKRSGGGGSPRGPRKSKDDGHRWYEAPDGTWSYMRSASKKKCQGGYVRSKQNPKFCEPRVGPVRPRGGGGPAIVHTYSQHSPSGRWSYPRNGQPCQRGSRSSKDKKWCYKRNVPGTPTTQDVAVAAAVVNAIAVTTGVTPTPGEVKKAAKKVKKTVETAIDTAAILGGVNAPRSSRRSK